MNAEPHIAVSVPEAQSDSVDFVAVGDFVDLAAPSLVDKGVDIEELAGDNEVGRVRNGGRSAPLRWDALVSTPNTRHAGSAIPVAIVGRAGGRVDTKVSIFGWCYLTRYSVLANDVDVHLLSERIHAGVHVAPLAVVKVSSASVIQMNAEPHIAVSVPEAQSDSVDFVAVGDFVDLAAPSLVDKGVDIEELAGDDRDD